MAKKVGILIVHGAGKHETGYADVLIKKIRKRLGSTAKHVAFTEAFWHHELQPRQEALMRIMAKKKMRWKVLRGFVVSHLGDVVAYQGVPFKDPYTYNKVHGYIHNSIVRLKDQLESEHSPLVVIAFSMGATVMSNYIWDRQQARPPDPMGGTLFEAMKTLCGFMTIGSNLPLFTLCVENPENITPITFPPPELDENMTHAWKNIYDPDDVLGYPLKPLPGYKNIDSLEDVIVNAGGPLKFWNPLSHTGYMKRSRKTVKVLADFIEEATHAVTRRAMAI